MVVAYRGSHRRREPHDDSRVARDTAVRRRTRFPGRRSPSRRASWRSATGWRASGRTCRCPTPRRSTATSARRRRSGSAAAGRRAIPPRAKLSAMDPATIALVVIPLVIIELGLMLYALYDLFQEDRRVRGDSKIMWALIIAFVNIFGPLRLLLRRPRRLARRSGDRRRRRRPGRSSIARILATWPPARRRHGRGHLDDRPDQAIRRRHRRPGPPEPDRPERQHLRLPGTQRRGQDHDPAPPHRARGRDRRHGHRGRRADRRDRRRAGPQHRLPGSGPALLRLDARPRAADDGRPAARAPRGGAAAAGRRGAGDRRPDRGRVTGGSAATRAACASVSASARR